MSLTTDKLEEELRSEVYTALLELSFASDEEKVNIAERVWCACCMLKDLIVKKTIWTGSNHPDDAFGSVAPTKSHSKKWTRAGGSRGT